MRSERSGGRTPASRDDPGITRRRRTRAVENAWTARGQLTRAVDRPGTARGQLSLPVVEAAVGVAAILAVAAAFGFALPAAGTATVQLDAYANDAATVLAGEPPRHAGGTRLAEVCRSRAAFERERTALRRRVDRILGANLMFRVTTPHGAVGYAVPTGVPVGRATVPTRNGRVVLRVWYA